MFGNDENNIDTLPSISSLQTFSNSLTTTCVTTKANPANPLSLTSKFSKRAKMSDMEEFLNAVSDDTVPKTKYTLRSGITEELNNFRLLVTRFNTQHQPSAQSSVKFWKTYQMSLPYLSKLAKQLLCTPATSVPAKSAFSKSAYLARKERAKLSGENLAATIFLKVSSN